MKTKTILAISIAAAFMVSTMGMAYANGHLTMEKAEVRVKDHPKTNDLGVKFEVTTAGNIPTDGSSGMIGYGFITTGDSIVITTSHAQLGILDSEVQGSSSDPAWHQHYAKLGVNTDCIAGADASQLEVLDLSFASTGVSKVDDNEVKITDIDLGVFVIDSSFGGTSTFTTGEPEGHAVLFHLDTTTPGGGPVCVVIDQVIESTD